MAGRHRARASVVRTMLAVAVPVVGAAAVATAVVLGSATVSAGGPGVAIPTFPSQERVLAANVVAVSAAPFAVHRSSDMAGGAVSAATTAVDRRVDEQRAAEARAQAEERAAARAEAAARSAEAAARAPQTSEAPAPRVAPRTTTAPRPSAVTPRSTPAPTTAPDLRARSASPEPTEDSDDDSGLLGDDGLLDGTLLGEGSLLGG
ncbi:hypothetical protein EV383_3337 [Pseudonocardia sediminis]|uniref:Uncharacterized protein n=1 Tax=Pseudonocardia sediminis TaxID=1397368 RepID=A0A4Q7UWU0_PSEST|nr:hypothetical protein [Pseudonocardia sediminis]RZT86442.1 hypothetical protein EV383_3337 [Pseudonocardia sediminis]